MTCGTPAFLPAPSAARYVAATLVPVHGAGATGAGTAVTIATASVAERARPLRNGGALGTMNPVVTGAGLAAPAAVGALVDAQGAAGCESSVLLSGLLLAVGVAASFLLVDPARGIARLGG